MKRSVLISIGAVTVALALIIILVFANRSNPVDDIAAELSAHEGEDPAVTESFATRVPEDAVFMASTTDKENMNEWWTFFSRLDYHDPGLPLSLNEDFTPDELMFASFPIEGEEDEGPTIASALYIRVDGNAVKFQDWLVEERTKNIEGIDEDPELALYNSIPIIAHTDFIIIPSNSSAYNALVEYVYDEDGEESNLPGITSNHNWADVSQINKSMLWADFSSYLDFYTSQESDLQDSIMEVISSASGYQDKTTFLGTSKDFGKSWSGVFPTGGFDNEKVDLNKAEQLINESINIGPGTITTEVDPGLMPLESVISSSTRIDEKGNIQTFGEVRPPQTSQSVAALVAVEDEFKTSVSFSPQLWKALFEGMTEYENLSHVTLDITENNSGRLSFSFYEEGAEESDS